MMSKPDQPSGDKVNVAFYLRQRAAKHPYKRAVVFPSARGADGRVAYTHLTFRQLDKESDRLAHGLQRIGITRGVRTSVMVPPGLDFFTLIFALFKIGAVPVIVDPGMGLKPMVRCLHQSRPEALIGIAKAHLLRGIYPRLLKTVRRWVTVGSPGLWGSITLDQLRVKPWKNFTVQATRRDETAAVLFTTGSTGPAKGVIYTHGNFDAQVRRIQTHFAISDDEIDLPTFPLFALFDPALGMTAIIPEMDPTRPARVNPRRIIEAVVNQGVTNLFASPALLHRVGVYGRAKGLKLPSLRRVVSAGAPVAPANIAQFAAMLSSPAEIHTPYGATEAMPVLSMGSREILSQTRRLSELGYGTCVGRPVADIQVRIITITDEPIAYWSPDLEVADGKIGEIVASGDLVTSAYFENPRADAQAKILEDGRVWHRMGDLGWRDRKQRVWFCGRKSHRVRTAEGEMYTIPCEAIFNTHPLVFRSALVGVGDPPDQKPVICIELEKELMGKRRSDIHGELLDLAASSPLTQDIDTIFFADVFPVDIRHNSKIFREQLASWAADKLN